MSADKNIKIAIIGAGPAGLTAAETLSLKGYKNITIFEKRDRVGGQSCSETYVTPAGNKIIYELGSLQPFGVSTSVIKSMLKKYDIHYGRTITANGPAYFVLHNLDTHQEDLNFRKYLLGKKYSLSMLKDLLADSFLLFKLMYRFRALSKSGYGQLSRELDAELGIPYEEWIAKQQFKMIGNDLNIMLGCILSFSSCTNKPDIPAIKFMKFLLHLCHLPLRYINGSYMPIREGYQELWRRVAKNYDIKLNANIESITRGQNEIVISTDSGEYIFDKMIITCAPFELEKCNYQTNDEIEIFSKVRYCPGWRGAFTAKNLPHDAAYYFSRPYFSADKPGLACFLPEGDLGNGEWLYGCVMAENKENNIDVIIANSNEVLRNEFHGQDIKWLKTVYWKEYGSYFPSKDVAAGIYKRIDSIQGKNNTYYLGELISCGSHSIVSAHADYIINKYF